jgi:hypothetical protein
MTSNITPITAANGGDTTPKRERERPKRGLRVLREAETKALAHLGMDALSEAHAVGHDLHQLLYGKDEIRDDRRQDLLAETLTCIETAEHYLLMLGSVFEEHPVRNGPPAAVPD